mgnify:CR=1 FL=1
MVGYIAMEQNQIIMKNFCKQKILQKIIIDDYGMLVMAKENQCKITQILHHQQQNQTILPQNQSSKIQTQTIQNHQAVEHITHDQKVDVSIILVVGKKFMFQKVIVDKKIPTLSGEVFYCFARFSCFHLCSVSILIIRKWRSTICFGWLSSSIGVQ